MSEACSRCNQEMTPGIGCTVSEWAGVPSVPSEEDGNCHDCNVAPGKYHHPGCDAEACGKCGGQVISCGCGNRPTCCECDYQLDEDGDCETEGCGMNDATPLL